MAGLGFKPAGNMAKASSNKPMGIQFVKSTDTAKSQHQLQYQSSPCPKSDSSLHQSGQLTSNPSCPTSKTNSIPALMSCQTRPTSVSQGKNDKAAPTPFQPFVKSGENYSSLQSNAVGFGSGYRMPGQFNLNKNAPKADSGQRVNTFHRVAEAKAVCSVEEYHKAWKFETDDELIKLRKLAYEVVSLKSDRPNAKDKLHSAANRVPVRIEFNTQPVFGAKNNNSFLCYVYVEGVSIASGQGPKIKDAKTNAYENALQKILMPYLRIVQIDPTTKELQVSKTPFTSPPPQPSKVPIAPNPPMVGKDQVKEVPSQHKESNLEAAGLKRRYNEYKALDEFVIVEPKIPIQDCTAAHTLRRSADFNHMLLEYEYFFKGESARCILKIENRVLADVQGVSKAAAKNAASLQALLKLKTFCWIIKTKQAVDSNTKISKEEMLNELNEQSDTIDQNNIGNKLLRKMGWSGGGVGKDGSGIAEPVALKSVLNREGLGLSASKGVTDEFRKRVKDVIETYASSDNQEDLVFSCDFRLEERQIIHDECRRLNLRSKSRGKGQKRYLCVRRKRSVNQLFDHLMSVGGETARYQLVPPGRDAGGEAGNSPYNGTPINPFTSSHNSINKSFPNSSNSPGLGNSHYGNYPSPENGSHSRNGQGLNCVPNQQGLFGHCPPQNGFSNTAGDNFHSNGKTPQSGSTNFPRPSGNFIGERPCQTPPPHFQRNFNDNFRQNGLNNSQYPHGNNSSNYNRSSTMHPPNMTNTSSHGPRPMGSGVQYGCPPPAMTNGFQPQNVHAMNQVRSAFQGFHNNMPVARAGFDAMNSNPMTPARGQQTPSSANPGVRMPGMMNSDWNSPGMGRQGANMAWTDMGAGGGNNFGCDMGMNPHQRMMYQPNMNNGNYNSGMRGGFR